MEDLSYSILQNSSITSLQIFSTITKIINCSIFPPLNWFDLHTYASCSQNSKTRHGSSSVLKFTFFFEGTRLNKLWSPPWNLAIRFSSVLRNCYVFLMKSTRHCGLNTKCLHKTQSGIWVNYCEWLETSCRWLVRSSFPITMWVFLRVKSGVVRNGVCFREQLMSVNEFR